ncbi:MAG: PolB1-binding protein PBP2 family protein [Candidatus Nezhaarchaeales archaeon]
MNLHEKVLAVARIIRYFKEFKSVGTIRAFLDLHEEGIPAEVIVETINRMIEKGILRHRDGILTYVGRGGGGPKFYPPLKAVRTLTCSNCGRVVGAYTYLHGRLVCLDCYKELVEGPRSHKDWIEEVLKSEKVNEAVKEALEEVREELESREKTYKRIKSRLGVREEELVEFLRSPKTAREVYERFGEEGLELVQILRREGKVWLKKVNGAWKYGVG